MTVAAARKLALALPGAEEKAHFDHPDFRVKNKIFATLRPAKNQAVLKLSRPEQLALMREQPDTFAPAWGKTGWTRVDLARVDPKEFRELLVDAWRATAPKRLVAAWDAKHGGN